MASMSPHVQRRAWGNGLGIALTCSECRQPLTHMVPTAYGVRASCGCPHVRWTAITEREPVEPPWVPEKRHPMTMAGTPKPATDPCCPWHLGHQECRYDRCCADCPAWAT